MDENKNNNTEQNITFDEKFAYIESIEDDFRDNLEQYESECEEYLNDDADINFNIPNTQSLDLVKLYLYESGQIPILTQEREAIVAKKVMDGMNATENLDSLYTKLDEAELKDDIKGIEKIVNAITREKKKIAEGEQAKDEMLKANLKLVISIAKRYHGDNLELLDLIQEGNLGLMKAIEKFDYRKGYRFSTYATWWIRQSITVSIANKAHTIRIPMHMVETLNKINKVKKVVSIETGKECTPEEIAEQINLPMDKLMDILKIIYTPVSLEQGVGDDESDGTIGDFIEDTSNSFLSPTEAAERTDLHNKLMEALDTLKPKEKEVIILRMGLNGSNAKTLEEVGAILGVTRERIRQIEKTALKKLRSPKKMRMLKDFVSEPYNI